MDNEKKLRVNLDQRSYDIIIKKGIIDNVGEYIKKVFVGKKIAIITDDNVNNLYGKNVKKNLEKYGFIVTIISFVAGEKSKCMETTLKVYDELLNFKFTRSDLIIAIGGGVVGDLAGFVSATFLRGVAFVQVPTSLLAQVDSSVGGKVGIDLPQGKNLVGSFNHPKLVLIDTNVLNTLEKKYFNDGLGEVIKYGCIKDLELFSKLESFENKEELKENMDKIVYTCCNIKREVVENDEKDLGERMLLNFGHTLGHAIEKVFGFEKYSHGEGVSIGMYEITAISEKMKLTKAGTADRIKELLKKYDLPFEVNLQFDELFGAISIDKKNIEGNLNLILIDQIGSSFIYKSDISFFK